MPVSRKRKKKPPKRNKLGYEPTRQLPDSGWHPELIKKVKESEFFKENKIKLGKEEHEVKVSALIFDFGRNILEDCVLEEDFRKYIPFIIMCWNTACLPEDAREGAITLMLEKIEVDDKGFEQETRMLIDRKIMFYDEYKYFISQYHISMQEGKPYLSVASVKLG